MLHMASEFLRCTIHAMESHKATTVIEWVIKGSHTQLSFNLELYIILP